MATISTIPNDASFPQGQVITDKLAMKAIFQNRLPGFAEGRLQIDALELLHFHYKPNKKCEVCYELQVTNLETGRAGSQILSGVVKPNGAAETKYAKAQRGVHFQPEWVPAIYFFSDLQMILWGFPNDVQLQQLPLLLERKTCLEIFRAHWPIFQHSPAVKLDKVTTTVIKYAPADRCTLRHELQLTNGQTLTIYSKTFSHKTDSGQIFKIMQMLRKTLTRDDAGAITIPEPLFLVPEMNTLFARGLEGKNVDEHLAAIDLDQMAAAIGAGLAHLHQCHLEGLPHYADQNLLAEITEAEEVLTNVEAYDKTAVAAVAETLRKKYSGLTAIAPAPIHGAFRLSQLLLVDGKIALIDFDDFKLGNPIVDVGSFVAHLLYLPLREKLTTEQSCSAIRHFCHAYAAAAPWGLPAEVLAWQTTAHLFGHQIKKCITLAKKDHPLKVSRLLDCANGILAGQNQLL